MSWIEGIGDEVTISVAVFFVITVLLVAWLSTGIRSKELSRKTCLYSNHCSCICMAF